VSYLTHLLGDWAYGVDLGNGGAANQWSAQELAAIQRQKMLNGPRPLQINRIPERSRPGGLTANQIEWCRANLRSFMPKVLP
jgi:hypothetical protein